MSEQLEGKRSLLIYLIRLQNYLVSRSLGDGQIDYGIGQNEFWRSFLLQYHTFRAVHWQYVFRLYTLTYKIK